jgi:hypothetical protein
MAGHNAGQHIDSLNTPVMSLATPNPPTGLPYQSGIQSSLGSAVDFSLPSGDLSAVANMPHAGGLGQSGWTGHPELASSIPSQEVGISPGSSLPIKGEPTGDDSGVTDDVFGSQALAALSEMGQVDDQVPKRPRLT